MCSQKNNCYNQHKDVLLSNKIIPTIGNKDPFSKLINKYSDIEKIMQNEPNKNIFQIFFFSKNVINKILYNDDKVLNIKYKDEMKKLSNNFYLNLLINYEGFLINYTYQIDLIISLNEEAKSKVGKYKSIILSKLIIDLINHYKNTDLFDEDKDEQILEKIEKESEERIKHNINYLNVLKIDFDYKKLLTKNIDEIYNEIIISLLKNEKFLDYDNSIKIFTELELLNIDITNEMFDKLRKTLTEDEIFEKEYFIKKSEDLFNLKKINFYFFLLKCVLKNSVYFYGMKFLLMSKKIILELLKKNNFKNILENKNKSFIGRLEYIIKTLSDSPFYWNKYLAVKFQELIEVRAYYKEFLFESKKKEIFNIEKILNKNNNKNELIEKYLEDYEKAKYMNLRSSIIKYLFTSKNNGLIKNEKNYNKEVEFWNEFENNILNHKSCNLSQQTKKILNNFTKNENNKELLLKIFNKNDYDYYINQISEDSNEKKILNNIKLSIQKEKEQKQTPLDDKNNNMDNSNSLIKDNLSNKEKITKEKTDHKKEGQILINEKEKNEIDAAPLVNKIDNNYDVIHSLSSKSSFYLNTIIKEGKKTFNFYKIVYGEKNIELKYEQILKYKLNFSGVKQKNELLNNFILLLDFIEETINELKKLFVLQYNLRLKFDFIKKDENKIDSKIYNITCFYTFYEPINNSTHRYKDENILINGINGNNSGFRYMLYDINGCIFENIKYKEYNPNEYIKENLDVVRKKENAKEQFSCIFNETADKSSINLLNNNFASKEAILEPLRSIGKHEYCPNLVIELSNGYVSGDSEKGLIIYNTDFCPIIKINDFNYSVYKVIEMNTTTEQNEQYISLLCCANKEINVLKMEKKNRNVNVKRYQIPNKTFVNCIEMKENNIVLIGKNPSYYTDIFNINGQFTEYSISEDYYKGGIKITDKILVLTSNSIRPNGKDKLIFYNIKTKKISNEINGYSFTDSINNMALIPREEVKQYNKVILCACKKYSREQKNGILLVNPNLGDNKRVENEFYNTYNFEVYCFCPILKFEDNNKGNENSKKLIDTNYFFVGGFDLDKREGKIKLFKVIFGEKAWKTKIKFLQDIEFLENKNFEEFQSPINCIIQSKKTGNIITTCYNKHVNLFTIPNIDYYLENDILSRLSININNINNV